jgi:UDP-N-acetylglucosamine 2-epimerase (non-hydrolysing)
MQIPVYHLEAGNRCYDDRVPEEINRRVIDHCSTVLMPYTNRSKDNLVREGIARQRIFVTGNPIREVIDAHHAAVDASEALIRLGVAPRRYFLATLHRAENVDSPDRLRRLMAGLARVAETFDEPVLMSVHPRTADKLARHAIHPDPSRVRLLQPLGLFDFLRLEQLAHCVMSDSGTVQEECSIFRVPSVTVRDVTERAETIEAGANILSGSDPVAMEQAVRTAVELPTDWTPPAEYLEARVSTAVVKIVLGYDHGANPGGSAV